MSEKGRGTGVSLGWLPWLILLPTIAFAVRQLDNPDTWWQLASGRWIARHHAVQVVDTLSYTVHGETWTNLQWGFDLLLYAVMLLGGATATVLLSAVTYTATVALLLLRLRGTTGPFLATGLAGWAVFIAQERFAVRPEMVSLLLLQILLLLFERDGPWSRRRLILVPALLLVWVNLHALFAVGLFVVACAAVSVLVAPRTGLRSFPGPSTLPDPLLRMRVLTAGALAFAVTLLNPYFLRGTLFPLVLLTRFDRSSAHAAISEFRSPFFAWFPNASLGAFQVFFFVSAGIVVTALVVGVRSPRRQRLDLFGLAIFVGLAGLALAAQRNAALFALGVAPIVGRALTVIGAHLRRPTWTRAPLVRPGLALGLATTLVAATWAVGSNEYYRRDHKSHASGIGVHQARNPVHAVKFFRQYGLPGRLYNDLTLGGYLTWDAPTEDGVFIDGRLEVYNEFFDEYRKGLLDPSIWQLQAKRHGINSVMLYHRSTNRHRLIRWLLGSPDWEFVYLDEVVVLFVRREGNERLLQRAGGAFRRQAESTRARLREQPDGPGYPQAYVLALLNYARGSDLIGDLETAAEFFELSVRYRIPRSQAAFCYQWLAAYSMTRRDLAQARNWLERASIADPANESVRAALQRLESMR